MNIKPQIIIMLDEFSTTDYGIYRHKKIKSTIYDSAYSSIQFTILSKIESASEVVGDII